MEQKFTLKIPNFHPVYTSKCTNFKIWKNHCLVDRTQSTPHIQPIPGLTVEKKCAILSESDTSSIDKQKDTEVRLA